MDNNYFLQMIQNLRQNEDILLYGNILTITKNETTSVIDFLKKEYGQEALEFPFTAPEFDESAAIWAAKTVYITAQLMLYRENKAVDLPGLLPNYSGEINAAAILSADLCLRFLPNMLQQLKFIDSEDALNEILINLLQQWHYSGINYQLENSNLNFEHIITNKCLHQLYVNRIIDTKNIQLAQHAACINLVKASLGNFATKFWNNFKTETIINE